jgi:hypothetical protein
MGLVPSLMPSERRQKADSTYCEKSTIDTNVRFAPTASVLPMVANSGSKRQATGRIDRFGGIADPP